MRSIIPRVAGMLVAYGGKRPFFASGGNTDGPALRGGGGKGIAIPDSLGGAGGQSQGGVGLAGPLLPTAMTFSRR